jgi:hypothetical protein
MLLCHTEGFEHIWGMCGRQESADGESLLSSKEMPPQ